MPITGVSTDYTSRKKDISIAYAISGSTAEAQVDNLKFGKISAYCTGIQKLIQRYMVTLLTSIGSETYYPNYGTSFFNIVGSNGLNQSDLTHIFNLANYRVLQTFQLYDAANQGVPADERLNTATLQDVITTATSVSLSILITTFAGTNITFIMPLPEQS